jgi:hypothetical protein
VIIWQLKIAPLTKGIKPKALMYQQKIKKTRKRICPAKTLYLPDPPQKSSPLREGFFIYFYSYRQGRPPSIWNKFELQITA